MLVSNLNVYEVFAVHRSDSGSPKTQGSSRGGHITEMNMRVDVSWQKPFTAKFDDLRVGRNIDNALSDPSDLATRDHNIDICQGGVRKPVDHIRMLQHKRVCGLPQKRRYQGEDNKESGVHRPPISLSTAKSGR
jgi:hypothetical protein